MNYIAPGKRTQNAFIGSFNSRLQDECLNEHVFATVTEAAEIVEAWRIDYNTNQPPSALGNLTPTELVAESTLAPLHNTSRLAQMRNGLKLPIAG